MNKFSDNLKSAADGMRLSSAEKERMRMNLRATLFHGQPPVPTPYRRFLLPRLAAVYACMGLLLVGGGTAYAAQKALPGDVLYPIKLNVNEKVEVALALSPEAKAKKNAEIAERRVEEVQTLANAGTLTASTAALAEKDFNSHASEVVRFAKDSRHKKEAAALTEKVASSFDTLGTTLLETSAQGKNEAAKENSEGFANRVRESAQIIRGIGIDEESGAGEIRPRLDDN